MHTPSDDAIRDRAYALWIEAGSPEGNDLHFWHAAEQELAGAEHAMGEAHSQDSADSQEPAMPSETPEQPSQY